MRFTWLSVCQDEERSVLGSRCRTDLGEGDTYRVEGLSGVVRLPGGREAEMRVAVELRYVRPGEVEMNVLPVEAEAEEAIVSVAPAP